MGMEKSFNNVKTLEVNSSLEAEKAVVKRFKGISVDAMERLNKNPSFENLAERF